MAVDAARLKAAAVVAGALRSTDFRNDLRRVQDEDGHHPVVIGLPDEPCREVFSLVRDAGGAAHIAVVDREELVILFCALGRQPLPHLPEPEDCPVHRETTLGMLLTYLTTFQPVVVCHEVAEELKVELLDARGPGVPA